MLLLVFALSTCAPLAQFSTSTLRPTLTPIPTLAPTQPPAPAPTATPTQVPAATATPVPGERQQAQVVRVVDGDTIVVFLPGGAADDQWYRVRYIGIDTPETHHPSEGASYLGYEATDANWALVGEGSTVVLQRDISETDQYGRLLRYVFVGETLVNAEIVRQGLARVRFYEPDVLYKAEIEAALAEAREAKRGLHGPRPTRPAETPLLRQGAAWIHAAGGGAVRLREDAARGEPVMALPAGIEVRVVDAFWVPERQEWWYWVGVNEFNGWTTGEFVTKEEPAQIAPGPPERWKAYDWLETTGQVIAYVKPSADSQVAAELDAGAPVQVKGLSWDESAGGWWYRIEGKASEGWVQSSSLR
jgi:micrococcal nuclease